MDFNRVLLGGRLTRDVEVKYTQQNKAVANIGFVVNHRFRAADGTVKEDATFLDMEAWGATAESMGKYLTKGSAVFIEGRLKLETWNDKSDGSKRSKVKVVVDTWQFAGPKPDGARTAAPTATATQRAPVGSGAKATAYEPINEDDIPF